MHRLRRDERPAHAREAGGLHGPGRVAAVPRNDEIETPRLRLLPLAEGCWEEYLERVHELWTRPEVRRYLWDAERVSRERTALILRQSAAGFRERGLGLWWVVEREGGEGIGFCGLRFTGEHDLVYGLLPGYWDRGLATEAVRAVLRHAFGSAGVRRITASADTGNAASLRVMEKAGMRRERRFTDRGRDLTSYDVLREGYDPSDEPG